MMNVVKLLFIFAGVITCSLLVFYSRLSFKNQNGSEVGHADNIKKLLDILHEAPKTFEEFKNRIEALNKNSDNKKHGKHETNAPIKNTEATDTNKPDGNENENKISSSLSLCSEKGSKLSTF